MRDGSLEHGGNERGREVVGGVLSGNEKRSQVIRVREGTRRVDGDSPVVRKVVGDQLHGN